MLCLQAVMSSACITNALCVIAAFNEFENTLNYAPPPPPPANRTRARRLNWLKTKEEHATVSQPVATLPVNAPTPCRKYRQRGTRHLRSDTLMLIG